MFITQWWLCLRAGIKVLAVYVHTGAHAAWALHLPKCCTWCGLCLQAGIQGSSCG